MRGNMKLLFLGVFSVAAVLAVGVLIVRSTMKQYADISQPSDATLEANFKLHESDLQLLVNMSEADNRVVRITSEFTWLDDNAAWPRPESQLGFSEARWDQYRRLFKEIGLAGGIAREKSGDVTYLIFSSKGLVTHGTEKGYAFSKNELTPTADSLDDVTRCQKEKASFLRN